MCIVSENRIAKKMEADLCRTLCHRGPDGVSYYRVSLVQNKSLFLVHNRLAIIDLDEEAKQPMIESHSGNAIVCNGEIYNYRELKESYKGIDWQTKSDTEVILKLYGHLGKDLVKKLNGIFAFAIYDRLH
ncbi:MAG: asparagine synthetase B, partial [Candidatus Omnitrophica bacterium]|nr:asparagine synthetase B [Candidatus Omnitrophota bacterium]